MQSEKVKTMRLLERSRRTPPRRISFKEDPASGVLVTSREASGELFDPTGQWMEPSDQLNVPSYELMEMSEWISSGSAGPS